MEEDHYIKQQSPLQLLTHKTIASAKDNSFYIVYVVAVNDKHVAYIELGREGKMQRKQVDDVVVVAFYWNDTGKWDGSIDWGGSILNSELRATAFASDGTPLYEIKYIDNEYVWQKVR